MYLNMCMCVYIRAYLCTYFVCLCVHMQDGEDVPEETIARATVPLDIHDQQKVLEDDYD